MKRLLPLLFLLLAIPAHAYDKSVAVVWSDFNYFTSFRTAVENGLAAVQSVLEEHGVTYDVFRAPPTNWCRTGNFGASPALPGSVPKSYRAVIHVGLDVGASTYGGGVTYDPRDLFQTGAVPGRGDSLPTVPQLFIPVPTGAPSIASAAACTTGAVDGLTYSGMSASPMVRDYGVAAYVPGRDIVWHYKLAHLPVKLSTLGSAIKFRTLVGQGSSASSDTVCHADCDSLMAGRLTSPDTMLVWKLDYSNFGKSSIVFTHGGVSLAEPDPGAIALGLAAIDSLCGNNLITKQMVIAFHVDDGWRRGASAGTNGGLYAPDSAAFKATLDSTRVWRIPVTYGAQISSMHTYVHQDSIWLLRHARDYFRITPHTHVGMDPHSTTGLQETVFGNSNPTTAPGMLDLFGSSRQRTRLYPTSWTGGYFARAAADTNVGSLQLAALLELKKRYPGRVDGLAMPPTDDWTPSFQTRTNMGPGLDSLARILKIAGYVGTRTNVSCLACLGLANGSESGFTSNPMNVPIRNADGSIADYFPVVPAPGYRNNGSMQWITGLDRASLNVKAMYVGFNGTNPAVSTANNQWPKCRIFAMHTNDLAGNAANYTGADRWGTGGSTKPKSPGWWEIKWTANFARAVNALSGKTRIAIGWPEDVARAQLGAN
jgi:hypothetical protein